MDMAIIFLIMYANVRIILEVIRFVGAYFAYGYFETNIRIMFRLYLNSCKCVMKARRAFEARVAVLDAFKCNNYFQ